MCVFRFMYFAYKHIKYIRVQCVRYGFVSTVSIIHIQGVRSGISIPEYILH